MAQGKHRLSAAFVRRVKHNPARITRYADGGGLVLVLERTGTRSWHLRWRHGGKDISYLLADASGTKLADARQMAEGAVEDLRHGITPSQRRAMDETQQLQRQEETSATLRALVQNFLDMKIEGGHWTNKKHIANIKASFNNDILDFDIEGELLGDKGGDEVTPLMIRSAVNHIKSRGATTMASRALQHLNAAYELAIDDELASKNPCRRQHRHLFPPAKRARKNHFPAMKAHQLADVMTAIHSVDKMSIVNLCFELQLLTALRPGECRQLRWKYARGWQAGSTGTAVLTVPAEAMKVTKNGPHRVPLSGQARAVLRELHEMTGKHASGLMFPSPRPRVQNAPLSEAAIAAMFKRAKLGGKLVPHGLRTMFASYCVEKYHPDAVELALHHLVKGTEARRTYIREADHWTTRADMMDDWGALVETCRPSGKVVSIHDREPA